MPTSCIGDIIGIIAPDQPHEEDQMEEFFQLANTAFKKLSCMAGRAHSKVVLILQTISHFRPSHPQDIFSGMEKIMTYIIHNSVDYNECSLELAKTLLACVKKGILGEKVFEDCADNLKIYLPEALRCMGTALDDYSDVVLSLYQDTSQRDNLAFQRLEHLLSHIMQEHTKLAEEVLQPSKKALVVYDLLGYVSFRRFYEREVTSFDHLNKMHLVDYDDGDHEILELTKECWQLVGYNNLSPHERKTVTAPSASTEMLNDRIRKSSHLSKRKKKFLLNSCHCQYQGTKERRFLKLSPREGLLADETKEAGA
ncbi:hypothetical protein Pfo_011796 [Paulownia fortunei]|nr:hypothetical protein Pfo_011796 [Paulownia fortunei]